MISIICVIGKNNAIGRSNRLIWNLPADLKRFREITSGHPIIMGRKTYESIGRPLPNRTNIVISRDQSYRAEGCIVVTSLETALEKAKAVEKEEVFIIGGGEIYRQALPACDKLYLTVVEDEPEADTFFPDHAEFTKIIKEETGEENGLKYKFIELEKDGKTDQ